MIAIFDLDGTLALTEHRQHFLEETPKNWEAFNAACVDDLPNEPVIKIFQTLNISIWNTVYILSGRSEDVRQETIKWLIKYELIKPWETRTKQLHMRKSGDFRDDTIIKKEIFENEIWDKLSFKIPLSNFIVFEDRQKVVDMWREMGLTCCQVAPGAF